MSPIGASTAETTPTVVVRPVEWRDFDNLRDIYFRLYDERERGLPIGITLFRARPSAADEAEWFSQQYQRVLSGDQVILVAEAAGRVVGSCSVGRVAASSASESGHVGELGILVDAAYRSQGVGTALMGRALEEARRLFDVVYLTVFSINEGAQRLYRRFGFVPCGHLPRMVKRGGQYLDEERMVLVYPEVTGPAGENR